MPTGRHVRLAIAFMPSPMAWMARPRREPIRPATDLIGSMACHRAPERLAGGSSVPAFGFFCHWVSIMPQSESPDHDQRLKVLIKEFFEAFFLCFFPDWAARFEFVEIDWLDKELFLAPPQGERRQLDLVARLKLRPDSPAPRAGATDLVALVHLELESRASALAFRPRMFEYYIQLRRDTGLPVLPIALFLRMGLDGIGWDAYEEHFWEHQIVRFDYAYVGLPALEGELYATGENLLGVALEPFRCGWGVIGPAGRVVRRGVETDRRFGRE